MKITEITVKYISLKEEAFSILESYQSPEEELKIIFDKVDSEYDKSFYKAIVTDSQSNQKLLLIYFSLDKNIPDSADVISIESFPNKTNQKLVHTSVGSDMSGIDMGRKSIKWLCANIKNFAETQGFKIKSIVSTTRSTGARAKNNKNNPGDLQLKQFDVKTRICENFIFDCITEELKFLQ